MRDFLDTVWQANIELSLLFLTVLLARTLIRKTTRVYNAYLLWLSVPVGIIAANLIPVIKLSEPPPFEVGQLVNTYLVEPAVTSNEGAVLGVVWSLVAVLLLLRLILQHRNLRRDLSAISTTDESAASSRYPVVCINQPDFSPAVYGFFKPKIYFPIHLTDTLSSSQINLIVQHEEHHIRQQHLWLNLLWDIVVCCLWFNPLVYFARQRFRHDQELYCDYLVLNQASSKDSKSYGQALLTTVSATHSVSLLCSWKAVQQLEERILNIKQETGLSAKLIVSVATLCIVLAASTYTVSAAHHDKAARFEHLETDEGSRRSVWQFDDTTIVEENGKRFAMENGVRRPLTAEEGIKFDKLIATPTPPIAPPMGTPVAPSKPAQPIEPVTPTEAGIVNPLEPSPIAAPPPPDPVSDSMLQSTNDAGPTKIIWINDGITSVEHNVERFIREIEIASATSPGEIRKIEMAVTSKSEIERERNTAQKKREKARTEANIKREKARIKRELKRARRNEERAKMNAQREALRIERAQRQAQGNQAKNQHKYTRNELPKDADTDVTSDFPKPSLQEDQSGNRRYAF